MYISKESCYFGTWLLVKCVQLLFSRSDNNHIDVASCFNIEIELLIARYSTRPSSTQKRQFKRIPILVRMRSASFDVWLPRQCILDANASVVMPNIPSHSDTRVTLYTAGHLHTAVPHCSHSRAPIVHTAVPRENNEHGCVYLRCRAVCKLPGCVEGHPWDIIRK